MMIIELYRKSFKHISQHKLYCLFALVLFIGINFWNDIYFKVISDNPTMSSMLVVLLITLFEILLIVSVFTTFMNKFSKTLIYYPAYLFRFLGYSLKVCLGFILIIYPGLKWGFEDYFAPELAIIEADNLQSGPEMSRSIFKKNPKQTILVILGAILPIFGNFLFFMILKKYVTEGMVVTFCSSLMASILTVMIISYTYEFLSKQSELMSD
tara:strand:+ start:218089 stop:218721 length:633 start_codon:yes stop_codon:yes gene_type:complete